MRLSLLLAAVMIPAVSGQAQAQPPADSSSLPTVEKPKATPKAKPVPKVPSNRTRKEDQTPSADPDPGATAAKPGTATDPDDPDHPKSDVAKEGDVEATGNSDAAGTKGGPDYTGPSILSRGTSFVRPSIPSNERFRPFAGVSFYHDSGGYVQPSGIGGQSINGSYSGADVNYGISGQHVRRFDTFQLDYRGHSYFGSQNSSQDQALSVGYSRVLARRLTVTLSESAGLYSNSFAVLNTFGQTDTSVANTTLVASPNTEPFNDKTYYSTSSADVAYQKTARLSMNFGGSTFYVHRDAVGLISANGYQARTDVGYRVTKRTTIGPYYAFNHFNYSGTFGDTGIHTIGLNYSVALDKRTQFGFRFGGTRLETRGLQQVNLDPVIAAVLGTTFGIQRYYTVSYLPDVAANISRSFRHSNVTFAYVRGVSPGNGVVLTAQHDSETVSYSYSGIRRYALLIAGGRDYLSSQSQNIGAFASYYARTSISRTLPHNLQGLFSIDFRKISNGTNLYSNQNQFRVTLGLAYSPGLGPLKFW